MLTVELRRRLPQIKIESAGNGLDALAMGRYFASGCFLHKIKENV